MKINSENFLFSKYEPNWWELMDCESMMPSIKNNIFGKQVKKYIVGYCDSLKTSLPKKDNYAVMFEKDGEEFWFHIPKILLDNILLNC